ncbi:MAG: glycosyltransferase family 4 protein [Ferruginibacter sp.]
MKILIPITYFAPQGGFRVLSELANHWIKLGHDVEFLVYKRSSGPAFPTTAKLTWYDNEGKIILQNDVNHKPPRLRIFSILLALKRAINTSSYDIILATQSLTAFPVYFSKRCDKKYYYIQAYEPEYYQTNSASSVLLKCLSKLSYKIKLLRIVNSPLYFDYKQIKANKFVFPGIDFTKFKPQPKTTDKKFIIGCIGRIEPFKGTAYVLEAYSKLKNDSGLDIELHIAFGDRALESIEGVKVIRIKNDDELAKYYNSVNVIIAPGTIQLGAVHYPVIEAMACKTPVITTGYYPANADNAWIVPIKNSDSIVEAVKYIIDDPDSVNRKIEEGYSQIQEFDWNIVSKKMLAYFDSN